MKPLPGPKTRPPLPACRAAARRRTAVKPATTTKAKKTAPMVMPTESLVACAAIESALTWSWVTVGDETDCAGGGVGVLIRAKDGAAVGAPELVGAGAVGDAVSAVGDAVGDTVGAVGDPVGVLVGHRLGEPVGDSVGPVGHFDGAAVGHSLGCAVGQSLGRAVGHAVGRIVVGHVAGGPAARADPSDAARAAAATAHLTRARIAGGQLGRGVRARDRKTGSDDNNASALRGRADARARRCERSSSRAFSNNFVFLALLADLSSTLALSSAQETGPCRARRDSSHAARVSRPSAAYPRGAARSARRRAARRAVATRRPTQHRRSTCGGRAAPRPARAGVLRGHVRGGRARGSSPLARASCLRSARWQSCQ